MQISIDGNIISNVAQIITHPGPIVGIAIVIFVMYIFYLAARWGDSRGSGNSSGQQFNTPFGQVSVNNGSQPQRRGGSGGFVFLVILVVVALVIFGAVAGTLPEV